MECPYCKNDITPKDGFCPVCHSPLPETQNEKELQESSANHAPGPKVEADNRPPVPLPPNAPETSESKTRQENASEPEIPLPTPQILLDDENKKKRARKTRRQPHLKQRNNVHPAAVKQSRAITFHAPSKRTVLTILIALILAVLGVFGWKYWQTIQAHNLQVSCDQSIQEWNKTARKLNSVKKDAQKEEQYATSSIQEQIHELMNRTILPPSNSCATNPSETKDRAQSQTAAAQRVTRNLQTLIKQSKRDRAQKQLHTAQQKLSKTLQDARKLLKDSQNKVQDENVRTKLQQAIQSAQKARTLKQINSANTRLTDTMKDVQKSMSDWQQTNRPAAQPAAPSKPAPTPAPTKPTPQPQSRKQVTPRRTYIPRRTYTPRRNTPTPSRPTAPQNSGRTWNVPPPSSGEGQL